MYVERRPLNSGSSFLLMRYFYEKPEKYIVSKARPYKCGNAMYEYCTLYVDGEKGLAVIQARWSEELKAIWFGPIDPWLIDDIYSSSYFLSYFDEHAGKAVNGQYPVVNVRKLMWAIRMKPLRKEPWEQELQGLY